jgi:hypothetical protein
VLRSDRTPSPPESFVVRIYRRDGRGRSRIAGTVEEVARGTETSFRNLRELQHILLHRRNP